MYKIGFCGAHGTGKTTLARLINEQIKLPFLTDTARQMWRDFGIDEFEKLPVTVRSYFQKEIILKIITREETEGVQGFISDRTVMDNWGYTKLSADMDTVDLRIYERIVKQHIMTYTHFVYIPVSSQFRAEQDKLRANLETQDTFASIIEESLSWVDPSKLLIIQNSELDLRVKEVINFVNIN